MLTSVTVGVGCSNSRCCSGEVEVGEVSQWMTVTLPVGGQGRAGPKYLWEELVGAAQQRWVVGGGCCVVDVLLPLLGVGLDQDRLKGHQD